jgi:glycosyltransferase involved in cell wall biosynthesis
MLLHEPYVHDKLKHGRMRSLLIAAHELAVRATLPLLDGVLVPSDEALLQMKAAYPDYPGTVLKVPLLFEDRSKAEASVRRYFSFIGHAVLVKGIDTFFEIVEVSASREAKWMFQIATSTDISVYLSRLSKNARACLHIVNKPRLPDSEIDEAIRTSWAVVAPHRRITQSGVVPVAFMHGTPVISTRVGGMPEWVIPGKTGYLISQEASFDEWQEAFRKVQTNFSDLSLNCRQFFLDHFDARLGPGFLRPMLESVFGN